MLETLYKLGLKLYPRTFQEEYSEAMLAVFREDGKAARHFADLLISVPREWFADTPEPAAGAMRLAPEYVADAADASTRDNQVVAFLAFVLTSIGVAFFGWKEWGAFLFVFYGTVNSLLLQAAKYIARRYWSSFGVSVENNQLVIFSREGNHRVRRDSITALVESPGRGLTISRAGKRDLWIPIGLVGYERLREELSSWRYLQVIPDGTGRILNI